MASLRTGSQQHTGIPAMQLAAAVVQLGIWLAVRLVRM